MNSTQDFGQLRVAAFESRRAEDMARLITRHGGQAFVSPSMREIPLGRNPQAEEFGRKVVAGRIDIVIFLTGVGFRHLADEVAEHVDREQYLNQLKQTTLVARGPKPVSAMKEAGLAADFRVEEPNTWRELLQLIDRRVPVADKTVAVQEYGQPNPQLTEGLQSRGATVISVPVYRWDLPEDPTELRNNVQAIAAGERDVALFTSAHQVVNMLTVARQCDVHDQFRAAFAGLVVASIGPTTSEMLRDEGLHVDLEPDHPRMGNLVAAAAQASQQLWQEKHP